MGVIKRNYRRWWQEPRKAGERLDQRQVSFLELFYDLVYVAIIAQLSHALATHMNISGIGNFIFMFIIIWWAWVNGALYHDLHGNNDVRTRVFTFLQMLSIIAMAVFAHNAIGEGSIGFALSFAFFQLIMTILWWRTGVYDKEHRALSDPYAAAFLVNTLLFIASAFVIEPIRYYLWGAAIVISLVLPIITLVVGSRHKKTKSQIAVVAQATPSIVERFGLFTIIVLGEVIVGVVNGVASHSITKSIALTALLGSFIAIAMWWLYFDFVSHRLPKPGITKLMFWYYLHLPMTMAITVIGAGTLYLLEHTVGDPVQSLISVALVIVLLCVAALVRIVKHQKRHEKFSHVASNVMIVSAIPILILSFISMNIITLLVLLVVLLLTPVFFGFLTWLKHDDPV